MNRSKQKTKWGEKYKMQILYHQKTEVCGFKIFKCCYCHLQAYDEKELITHIQKNHMKLTKVHVNISAKTNPKRKAFHCLFPIWLGTVLTDRALQYWLLVHGRKNSTLSCINVVIAAVECLDLNISKYYCTLCGFESDSNIGVQKQHIIDSHLEYIPLSDSSRYYCTV
jgi:hypothetical protein